jgi:imidazolonepropionase-like amidohydrolase
MKSLLILWFTILSSAGYCQDILIERINIIDVVNGKIIYGRHILIAKNKIQKISRKSIKLKEALVINGRDKFIMPGLWDMHVHTADSSYLNMFIINGVTGTRDMGGAASSANNGCESIKPEILLNWRKLIKEGIMMGPRMFISGPAVSNTGWPTSINIDTKEKAKNAVLQLKALGVDFIKVYEDIPLPVYQSLAMEAKLVGLSIAGHVPHKTVSLLEASNAGQRSIEHIRDPLLMSYTKDKQELLTFFKEDNWSASDITWGLERFDETGKLIEAFKKNNTWLVPTLTVESAKVNVTDSMFIEDNRRVMLPASVQQALRDYVTKKHSLSIEDKKSDKIWWQKQKQLVKRMHDAGIPLMAGTDCACQGGLPGYSLHRELALFVEAGLSNAGALKTATINPARFLAMTDSLGSVEKGKIADLVILDSNPLKNIAATQAIFAVILNGQIISKESIDKIKKDLLP